MEPTSSQPSLSQVSSKRACSSRASCVAIAERARGYSVHVASVQWRCGVGQGSGNWRHAGLQRRAERRLGMRTGARTTGRGREVRGGLRAVVGEQGTEKAGMIV